MGYEPGNYWVICDRCGFKRRIKEAKSTWDNLLVCYPECWEPRHPQDFVRGKADRQSVPIARPEVTTTLRSTLLSSAAAMGALTIEVADVTNISDEIGVGIVLDDGSTHWTMVDGTPAGSTVTLFEGLFGAAASGNVVYLSVATGDTFI